jgi:hypothetical protein
MGMTGISKSQVSRLCGEIDGKIAAFLDRPLEGEWPYVWLDATYVKARRDGHVVSLARTASPLRVPLHPDIMLLAQCRRGLLFKADPAAAQTRSVPFDCRSPSRYQSFPRRDQCRPQALRVDRAPRARHHRCPAWDASLESVHKWFKSDA